MADVDRVRRVARLRSPRRPTAPGARPPRLRHPCAGSAAGRAGGPGGPATARPRRARSAGRPSAAAAAQACRPDGARPRADHRSSSAARDATTADCGLAAAAICEPRGRLAQYASDSSSDTTPTAPVTRIWRCSASQGSTSAARGFGQRLAALARRAVREQHEPALVEALQQHGPRRRTAVALAVANVIALGSWTPAATASAEPARRLLHPGRREVGLVQPGQRVALAHRREIRCAADEPVEQPVELGRRVVAQPRVDRRRLHDRARRRRQPAEALRRVHPRHRPRVRVAGGDRGQRLQVRAHGALLEPGGQCVRAAQPAGAPAPAGSGACGRRRRRRR